MGTEPETRRHPAPVSVTGDFVAQRIGLKRPFWLDLYHALVSGSWWRLLGVVSATFIAVALLFAVAFYLKPGSIERSRPDVFWDAFNFSVQTLSTLGYGTMAPKTTYAHVLVTAEMLLSLLLTAVATGLVFAKFARPTAKILFSDVALISKNPGGHVLSFRMGNERANRIMNAELRVTYGRSETDETGATRRTLVDLPLRRSVAPLLVHTWSTFHDIDRDSPFFGKSSEDIEAEDGSLIVSVTGVDDELATSVHAQHVYMAHSIVWNARFVDVLERGDRGETLVRYDRFHEYISETT